MSDKVAVSSGFARREHFSSRLGFILISAGCAIGLGNVWRFPYITGQYGGAAFVLLYITFMLVLSLPIMVMELAVGRASQRSIGGAFEALEPRGTKWHVFKWFAIGGNYLLMMFYTVVAGWMFSYIFKMATGAFQGASAETAAQVFNALTSNPSELVGWMVAVCAIAMFICSMGLQKGVERITKAMMVCLLAIIVVLIVRSVTLPGAAEGLAFYLKPDFSKMFASPAAFAEVAGAAMGQAFFTLSVGMGGMAIFGSYIAKDRSLTGEAATIGALDTFVALCAGLIIFPACFAFGVQPDSGPGLVFVTLPSVFDQMWGGRLWGTLFFLFMTFAALSTVVAVFENIVSFWMDRKGWDRQKAVSVNLVAIATLSIPCALGFNVWSGFAVPGIGNVQAAEDFVVSNLLMPLGSLVFLLFCTTKYGWGWKSFLAEANTGSGAKFPTALYWWMRFGVPAFIVLLLIMGWSGPVAAWLGIGQ